MPNRTPDEYKFVFIGGLHRSGTSLLAKVLSQHPSISGFSNTGVVEDEGQFLQTVYPDDNVHGGAGRFVFDPGAHLTETSSIITENNKEKLWKEWSSYWDLEKRVLIEKTPGNLIKARFLQSMLPNCYFIFILRHPIANALANYKWSGTGIYSLIHHWVLGHELMKSDIPHLDNLLVLSYESFTKQPDNALLQIEDFLDLNHFSYNFDINGQINKKYFDLWYMLFYSESNRTKPVTTIDQFNSYKQKFPNINWKRAAKMYIRKHLFGEDRQLSSTKFESQDAVSVFEQRINTFGYSLINLDIYPDNIVEYK